MHTEPGSWQRAWRRVGKAEVEVEVDRHGRGDTGGGGGGGGGRASRGGGRRRRGRRRTTLIKSKNPHLAGGE